MEKIPNQQQTTENGEQSGKRLRLPDLPDYKLGGEGELNPFNATDSEFLQFVQTLVPLEGEGLDQWTWMERRDFLNWCLDEGVLTIQNGRLVPAEESVPTAPLTQDTDAHAPNSAEEAGLLRDVERAKPVIASNPAISAQELAEALGLNSVVSAQSLKVYVNAHKSEG